MGTGLYKWTHGGRKELTSREVKAYIMEVNGWTKEEYDKKYDIFKNKLRAYEAYERSHGAKTPKQSPVQVLFKEAKAKSSQGSTYQPSIKMQRIQAFTSVSSGKAGQKALKGKKYQERRAKTYETATSKQFAGLIAKNAKAREIAEAIKDPVKREKALAEYANKLHAKIDAEGRVRESEAIPFGQTFGSSDEIEFDYSSYLE